MNPDIKNIRNFCIIAHIDHGKSTLADRMLELTGAVEKRDMKEQLLDQMDLERERGITIKLAPVRMIWKPNHPNLKFKIYNLQSNLNVSNIENSKLKIENSNSEFTLNLIDTPGHVDFAYEVSRSLAAVEGAVLLVDATQGIEAQTLSVLYAAMEHDLSIIPVVNKIDLPAAKPEETADEIVKILGCDKSEIIFASGKTGEGVARILDAIIERVAPPPSHLLGVEGEVLKKVKSQTRALIFDSIYDPYRGVVCYVRIVDGEIKTGDQFALMQTGSGGEVLEVGYFSPQLIPHSPLSTGEIGYTVTGFKDVAEAQVGDTITLKNNPAAAPLPGYKKVLPLVFASIFCADGSDYPELKEAIEKLKLNDASLSFEPEHSDALGFGFRCGFLGLLHLDIVKERLEREYDLSLVISSPTVEYLVKKSEIRNPKSETNEESFENLKINNLDIVPHSDGIPPEAVISNLDIRYSNLESVSRPSDFPSSGTYQEILEPMVRLEIFSPKEYIGDLMKVVQPKRAIFETTEYLDEHRSILKYRIPLAEVIIDLYDLIKSVSRGYASMNYEMSGYEAAELEKVDILIAEEKVDALSFIVHKSKAFSEGKRIVERLKELIPRQNFEIKIQALIGAQIIASERISPFRKDVTAKLYGGDVTRKNKLLEKQKKGKKKMKQIGNVEMPSDVFVKVLRNE